MGQIVTKHFVADGSAYNLDLGFEPSYVRVANANATSAEAMVLEWWCDHAEMIQIDADGDVTSPTSTLALYNSNSISTTNPVTVSGTQGVTIPAAFMDDSDVIFVLAIEADRDEDVGDVA